MRGNPDNLRQAAARKSAAAQARAEQGLHEIIRRNEPITFRGLAQTAGVSPDFLYRCTPIRQRVQQLRAQQQNTPPPAEPPRPRTEHRAASSAPSPPNSPNSNGVTVTRSAPSNKRSRPHTARTSNYGAASAPNETATTPRHPDAPFADAYANDLTAQTHKFTIITPDTTST